MDIIDLQDPTLPQQIQMDEDYENFLPLFLNPLTIAIGLNKRDKDMLKKYKGEKEAQYLSNKSCEGLQDLMPNAERELKDEESKVRKAKGLNRKIQRGKVFIMRDIITTMKGMYKDATCGITQKVISASVGAYQQQQTPQAVPTQVDVSEVVGGTPASMGKPTPAPTLPSGKSATPSESEDEEDDTEEKPKKSKKTKISVGEDAPKKNNKTLIYIGGGLVAFVLAIVLLKKK